MSQTSPSEPVGKSTNLKEKEIDEKLRVQRKLVEYYKQQLEILKVKLQILEAKKELEKHGIKADEEIAVE